MAYFAIEFHREYVHPEYQKYPPRYDYSVNSTQILPQDGNTIAILLDSSIHMNDTIHKYARVNFYTHGNSDHVTTYIEAVLCSDLYAE